MRASRKSREGVCVRLVFNFQQAHYELKNPNNVKNSGVRILRDVPKSSNEIFRP